ncbi:MAG: hypothetical protein R6X29_02620 [Acidimicrobiia bacterium]
MTGKEWAILVLVTIPLWVVVTGSAIQLLRRTDIGGWRKLLWLLAIVGLPAIGTAVYLVVRPVPLVQDTREQHGGPGAELTDLIDRLAAGDLGRPAFEEGVGRLLSAALGDRPAHHIVDE